MADSFPEQLAKAARTYPNICNAFAQLHQLVGTGHIELRIQALDIMMEFVGDVKFGRDPKGLLFHRPELYLGVQAANYQVSYHKGAGPFVTVKVEFYAPSGKLEPFARFLANVDTHKFPLPPLPTSPAKGVGNWKRFIAATTEANIHSRTNSRQVNMTCPPIWKQVYFQTKAEIPIAIDTTGVLIFTNERNLRTIPEPHRQCVVDYAADRIVFHPLGEPDFVIALFLPGERLPINDPSDRAIAIWEEYESEVDQY